MHQHLPGWWCRFPNKRVFQFQSPFSVGIFLGFGLAYILITYQAIPPSTCRTIFSQPSPHASDLDRMVEEAKLERVSRSTNYSNKPLQGNGVISRVRAGIGNQLFHYACTYALARDRNLTLYNFVPTASSVPGSRRFLQDERQFALDKFQIPLTNLINESTSIDASAITYVNDSQLLFRTYPLDHNFLQLSPDSYCIAYGYWAQYKKDIVAMFQLRPEVVQEFSPYVTNLGKEIENSEESVAVHVRKGDFKLKGSMDLPISFQRDSIYKISNMLEQRQNTNSSLRRPLKRPKFFIFSDDIEYCRRELNNLSNVHDLVFVSSLETGSRTTSLEDFYLMIKCKHFIVPNSSFGWWAAYLGTHKGDDDSWNSESIVIAAENKPGYWKHPSYENRERFNFYRNVVHEFVLFPKDWTIYNPLN